MEKIDSVCRLSRQTRTSALGRKTSFQEFLPLFKRTSTLKKNKKFKPDFRKLLSESDTESIIGLLLNSTIIKKIKRDSNHSKIENLVYFISQAISVREYRANQLLFNMGDKGESMYIVLKGKVGVYKPFKEKISMKVTNYLGWLKKLYKAKKIGLLKMNLTENRLLIPLTVPDMKNIDLIINILNCERALLNVTTVREAQSLFESTSIRPSVFNINFNDKFLSNESVSNKIYDYYSSADYRSTKAKFFCLLRLQIEEEFVIVDEKLFITLDKNNHFGDLALDSKLSLRNATVRVEEDSILGIIKEEIYRNFILSEKKKIRMKEVNYLAKNFFFNHIQESVFDKSYFDLFTSFKYPVGHKLMSQKEETAVIYFIFKGKVQLSSNIDLISIEKVFRENKDNSFSIGMWGSRNMSDLFVEHNYKLYSLNGTSLLGFEESNKKSLVDAVVTEKVEGFSIEMKDLMTIVKDSVEAKSDFEQFVKVKKHILRSTLRIHGLKTLEVIKNKMGIQCNDKKQSGSRSPTNRMSNAIRLEKKPMRKAISPQQTVVRKIRSRRELFAEENTKAKHKRQVEIDKRFFRALSPASENSPREISYEQRLFRKIKKDFLKTKNFLPNVGFIHTYIKE